MAAMFTHLVFPFAAVIIGLPGSSFAALRNSRVTDCANTEFSIPMGAIISRFRRLSKKPSGQLSKKCVASNATATFDRSVFLLSFDKLRVVRADPSASSLRQAQAKQEKLF